ncbi:amidase, partial [Archaeoglobales archaeon]
MDFWMSAFELVERLKSDLKASEVVEMYLEKIRELNPKINAFITINENAVKEAKEVEKELEREDKPLAGLPIAVKDNVETKGIRTTYASKFYEDYVPQEDAVIIERLKKAGAVIIGKTNLPELGLIAYTDNP